MERCAAPEEMFKILEPVPKQGSSFWVRKTGPSKLI